MLVRASGAIARRYRSSRVDPICGDACVYSFESYRGMAVAMGSRRCDVVVEFLAIVSESRAMTIVQDKNGVTIAAKYKMDA